MKNELNFQGIIVTEELITPKVATQYLELNTRNRPKKTERIAGMVHDLQRGAWTPCLACVAFYTDGVLADGQNRLEAIVQADVAVPLMVARNVPIEATLNIDTGVARSFVDTMHISGRTTVSSTLAALCRAVEEGNRASHGLTNTDREAFLEKHTEAAQFAHSFGGRTRGVKNIAVNAAIARAWYVERDKERLKEFGEMISSGIYKNAAEDSAAMTVRKVLTSGIRLAMDGPAWVDMFYKVQNAIWYFMRRESLNSLRGIADERYPLGKIRRTLVEPSKPEPITGTLHVKKKDAGPGVGNAVNKGVKAEKLSKIAKAQMETMTGMLTKFRPQYIKMAVGDVVTIQTGGLNSVKLRSTITKDMRRIWGVGGSTSTISKGGVIEIMRLK